jgi:hypothetical protein
MIVYQSTKTEFIIDVTSGSIDDIIKAKVLEKLNRNTRHSETESWRNSLIYISNVITYEAMQVADKKINLKKNKK